MRLSPRKFNGMLKEMGQAVEWRRAYLCPCRDPYSGAARQGCPQCHGKGVLWADAVAAWTGVAGMKVAREWAQFGLWESGDVVLTVPSDSPMYAAGENDRVTMIQSSEPFSTQLTRDGTDKLPFEVQVIDRVFFLKADDSSIVDCGIPTVADDGSLSWGTPALAPDPGVQYSVTGRKRPEYYLFREFPNDRAHFGGLSLPRKVILRKFDLFGR